MKIRFLSVHPTCAFLFFFALTAHAALETDTWTGGTGSWTNASNWSLNVVPNNNNGSNNQYVVDIPAASAVLINQSLNFTVNSVVLDANSSLTLTDGVTLAVLNGLTNNAVLTLASGSLYGFANLNFSGTQTLAGNGQILLTGPSPSGNHLNASGTLTIGSGITIHGGGSIQGDCANPLVNLGTISADTNLTLAVFCFVNQGRLNALNGGTLQLAGTWSSAAGVISNNASSINLGGTFTTAGLGSIVDIGGGRITLGGTLINTNTTLTLTATTGSWFLNGGTIQGGTVNASGGAQLLTTQGGGGTLNGVTLASSLTLTDGVTLAVLNGLTNNAVLTLASGSLYGFANLNFSGTQTLAGNGQILLTGPFPSGNHLTASGTLTIGSGITIHGGGSIQGDCANPLVNLGTISADTNLTLTVSCFVNQGQMVATNGGIMNLHFPINLTGVVTIDNASTVEFQGNYVQSGGSTVLNGGQLVPTAGGSVLIQGGSLGGGGFVNAIVTNFGSIVPGPAASALTFSSNLVVNAGSILNFQFAGAFNSQYGQVVLSNGVNLAGSLAITLMNGFVPEPGSSFTVLTSAQPITGGFVNATSGFRIQTLNGAGSFVYIQNANSIVLGNFQVNSQAYLTWAQSYFGCTNCSQSSEIADPDGDGVNNYDEFASGFNPTNATAYPHIISIARTNSNTDIRVTYLAANGDSTWTPGFQSRTNVLEYATGAADGSYFATTNFVSTGQTNILNGGTGLGIVTNMVDHGGATNQPARYYRVKIIAP